METETLELKHGYKAIIAPNENAENPWESWDGCVPIATQSRWSKTNYDLGVEDVVAAIAPAQWKCRKTKRDLLRAVGLSIGEAAQELRDGAEFEDLIFEEAREAGNELETITALCDALAIPYHETTSQGYSQGDWVDIIAVALPDWVKRNHLSGETYERLTGQCKDACKLWGQWTWGDVYGVAAIIAPDGREVEHGSVWGFYGSNFDASGLLDHCHDVVAWDASKQKQERAAAFDMACRDIATI